MQIVQFGVSGAAQRSRHGVALPVPRAFLTGTCLGYHARVTYDIYFVRPQTGRTLLQMLEVANAEFDLDAEPEPLRLTPEQRAAWDRIAMVTEQETGLAGYDPQADQPTAGGDLALAATQLGQTALWVQENLARRPSARHMRRPPSRAAARIRRISYATEVPKDRSAAPMAIGPKCALASRRLSPLPASARRQVRSGGSSGAG